MNTPECGAHYVTSICIHNSQRTKHKYMYFTIFQDKLHSFNIQNRTKHSWAFSKTVQKISKITYTASRFSLLTSAKFSVNIKRVTLQHNKEFTLFIFLFNGFIMMCNLKKRLIRAAFWVLLQVMFMNDWKQTAKRLKLQETTNNQYKKCNSMKHLQRHQLSFTKTSIKASLKVPSL